MAGFHLNKENPYYQDFIKNIVKAPMDLKSAAYQQSKRKALFYLISMHKEGDEFIWPFIADDAESFAIMDLYKSQKKMFEEKQYGQLMLLIETVNLVFSAVTLAKDQGFMDYCQLNGTEFVRDYLNNALHEAGLTQYFVHVVDPGFRPTANVMHNTGLGSHAAELEKKPSITKFGMFALATGVAGLARAAYYLSNQKVV